MAELRIRVGAAVDASFDRVLRSVESASRRSSRAVASESQKASRELGTSMKKGASEAERAYADLVAEVTGEGKRMMNPAVHAISQFGRTAKGSFDGVMTEFRVMTRDIEREMRRLERQQASNPLFRDIKFSKELTAAGSGVRSGGQIAGRALRAGIGIASDIARGAGVDFSLSSNVAKNVDLEKHAVELSNSGFIAGDAGANGKRVDPAALIAQARQVGSATATDPSAIIAGLQKFTGLSGDLDTGRQVLGDLARLSKATGTDFDDMAAAAGNLVLELGDVPNKGEVIGQIMRSIAGQGKLGAVEISDMASQMAKLAANAGRFEGSVAENVVLLGAFAQEARQRGGAASATQAATSVAGMVNTLVTPARIAAFKHVGVHVINEKSGLVRNPEEILIESLKKVGTNPEAFKKLYANVQGARAVEGFATLYRQVGGGEAGEAAVRTEFARLKQIAIAEGEVAESLAAAMKTAGSQATQFNIELEKTTAELQKGATPILSALAPLFIDITNGIAAAIKGGTGVDVEDESKQKFADDVLEANVGSDIGFLNRAGLGKLPIGEGQLNHASEDLVALDAEIARKKASFAKERTQLEGFQGGPVGPMTQKRTDEIHTLEQRRNDLRGAIEHVRGELLEGFRLLKDGVLTVRIEDGALVRPLPRADGTMPANAPEVFAP